MSWQTQLGTAVAVLAGSWLALHSAGVQWQFPPTKPATSTTEGTAIEPVGSKPVGSRPVGIETAAKGAASPGEHSPRLVEAQLTELSSVVAQLMRDVANLQQELQQARVNQPTLAARPIAQPRVPPTPEDLQRQMTSAADETTAAARFIAEAPDLAVEAAVQAGWNQLQTELVDSDFPAFTVDALRCGSTLCKVTFGHDQMDQGIVELLLSSMSTLGVESVELSDNAGTAYLTKASSRPLAMGVH